MAESITPDQVRLTNSENIYRFIYKHQRVSQMDLHYELRLSRPTITANLKWMEEKGLIRREGQVDSGLAGRKAIGYALSPSYRLSVGLQLLAHEIKIMITDLLGGIVHGQIVQIEYANDDAYFRDVCGKLMDFLSDSACDPGQVLGVGIAVQGLTSPDGQSIIYGKILDCRGLTVDVFEKYLPFPCLFVHDSFSAATSELWASPDLKDAFYLSLCDHLGAALISNGRISLGMHGHNATIEHIQIVPGGKRCYCGNYGCVETMVSVDSLLEEHETLETFFSGVRSGDPDFLRRWEHYLSGLSSLIYGIHLIYDVPIILGGDLAAYLLNEDIDSIYRHIQPKIPFLEEQDYICLSKMPLHGITRGASLPFITRFLEHPCS